MSGSTDSTVSGDLPLCYPFATPLMLLLSFGTGVLDAATFLGLHEVFTANMTGNVIFIGLGIAGYSEIPLVRAGLALAGFALGAAVAGRLHRELTVDRRVRQIRVAVTLLIAGMVATAACLVLATMSPSPMVLDVVTIHFAAAMGLQAVAARTLGVADVTTVVVTSTLVGLAADHRWGSRLAAFSRNSRRAAAIGTMGLGALVGALLLQYSLLLATAFNAAILVFVGAAGALHALRLRSAVTTS